MPIAKRYQVFVSSTFADLQEERQEVMQALLELNCIPAGMELFPAANDDQWTLIQRVIDDCDYYLVIVGGRYGSLSSSGLSYTEMEYRYALDKNKPVIAFLHKNPGDIPTRNAEQIPGSREKLEVFRALVKMKMVKFWTTPSELGSVVSRSLVHLMSNCPAPGWIKADKAITESAAEEILKLRKRIDELELELDTARHSAPKGASELAQEEDEIELSFSMKLFRGVTPAGTWSNSRSFDWRSIAYELLPSMIDEASDDVLRARINRMIQLYHSGELIAELEGQDKKWAGVSLGEFAISESDFETVKIQLRALGMIAKSKRTRSVKDKSTYWTLTAHGDEIMVQLRAIEKPKSTKRKTKS